MSDGSDKPYATGKRPSKLQMQLKGRPFLRRMVWAEVLSPPKSVKGARPVLGPRWKKD